MNLELKDWLIKNWYKILVFIVVGCIVIFLITMLMKGLSSQAEIESWFKKPLSQFKISDIFILLIIHALISRSEHKCNCK